MHKDKKDKVKKVAAAVGGGALVFSGVIIKYGIKAFGVVNKIKG